MRRMPPSFSNRLITVGLLLAVSVPALYVLSFGPAFVCLRWADEPTTNRVLSFYRPMFRVMPERIMQEYIDVCGTTEIEAFFLVQALRSDLVLETNPDTRFNPYPGSQN